MERRTSTPGLTTNRRMNSAMANRAYSTPIHTWAFHLFCTSLPALIAPVLIALALYGMATPDPVVAGHAALKLEAVR
ncbi:hypothetical protein NKW53_00855 [Acetobacter orientalis]|uniref:hypothetical protein n=2 Tax=Acetobacter orientalis TaxID=146474 RepID=UPI0020A4B04A|nr:hypothetical protein [Acetobacter orientalis]MCP1214617.1 hypothetical protein [Acetobacter orientalis]